MTTLELLHQHITKDSRVQGGRAVIVGSRISVSDIVYWYKQGKDVHEILEFYPHLTLAQIHDALAYYYDHQTEIDEEITTSQKE